MICQTYISFFKSLVDPSRLEIIKLIRTGPKSVTEISNELNYEQSRVSHNLKKLKKLGFVEIKKQGKQRIYSIEKKTILPLLKLIDNHVDKYYKHYCKCTGEAKRLRWKK